jgi:IS1 family transposase
MRSFYHDKKHQIWLWRAIDHETAKLLPSGLVRREYKHLDKLRELLEPLNTGNA